MPPISRRFAAVIRVKGVPTRYLVRGYNILALVVYFMGDNEIEIRKKKHDNGMAFSAVNFLFFIFIG